MLPAKPFYMIRHGETEANRDCIMAGHTDSPLTDTGRKQARKVQGVVKALDIKPSVIVHSNLSRARDTATIINEVLNVPMHENPDLAELFAGDWEGVPYEECLDAFTSHDTPPNGESFEAFFNRVRQGIKKTLEVFEEPPLIVVHGGVMRAMGGIYSISVPSIFRNCHLYEFRPSPEKLPFPWNVSSYENSPEIVRVKEETYDNSEQL